MWVCGHVAASDNSLLDLSPEIDSGRFGGCISQSKGTSAKSWSFVTNHPSALTGSVKEHTIVVVTRDLCADNGPRYVPFACLPCHPKLN